MKKSLLCAGLCFLLGLSTGPAQAENLSQALAVCFQALRLIASEALQQPSQEALLQGASKGLVNTLGDPYSVYLPPEVYSALSAEKSGEVVGIGVELTYQNDQLTVMSVLPETPAERAGLQAGDQILAIDGQDVSRLSWPEASRLLQGQLGQPLRMRFRHESGDVLERSLRRERLRLEAFQFQALSGGLCELRLITFFNEALSSDLQKALLNAETDCPQGMIVDLRNNPGGLIESAVEVAGLLGVEGPVLHVVSRDGGRQTVEALTPTLYSLPMVVLIDQGSASAAEILAAALQESGRAALMGETSFGKGLVQSLLPLSDQSGLSLTTHRYLTRRGLDIHGVGVTPDFELLPEPDNPNAWLEYAQEYLKPSP